MTKKCISCYEIKTFNDFHNTKSNKDGKASYCKKCTLAKVKEYYYSENGNAKKKAANRRLVTGFTSEDFNIQFEKQGGVCAICGTDDPGTTDFCADHNHDTGQKRGILCRKCNSGLANFKENPEIIAKAIEYLKHYTALSEGNQ